MVWHMCVCHGVTSPEGVGGVTEWSLLSLFGRHHVRACLACHTAPQALNVSLNVAHSLYGTFIWCVYMVRLYGAFIWCVCMVCVVCACVCGVCVWCAFVCGVYVRGAWCVCGCVCVCVYARVWCVLFVL